jgi:hypothetical protein
MLEKGVIIAWRARAGSAPDGGYARIGGRGPGSRWYDCHLLAGHALDIEAHAIRDPKSSAAAACRACAAAVGYRPARGVVRG